jgi:choline dehydrogenase
MTSNFDFIVVGSGSAGGVVATRLSESGKYTVACIEAGTHGAKYLWSRPPAGVAYMFDNPEVNWCWQAEPNADLCGRQLNTPSGKILGGTSAINGMIYNRGQRMDYDGWAALGCNGWSYQDVLPYFKKIECTAIGSDEYRGRKGPVKVTLAGKTSSFFDLFIQSAQQVGLPLNPDYSGETQYGVAMAQYTVYRGMRNSTATQYLGPAAGRQNLEIIRGAQVTSLILEGRRCVGVRFRRDGVDTELRAGRAVVLSAGAFGSPRLLELSGIGNPDVLSRLGINVVHALPGVGENLRDHYGPAMQWTFKEKGISLAGCGEGWRLAREIARYMLFRKGFIAEGWGTMRVFDKSCEGKFQADVALLATPFLIEDKGKRRGMSNVDGFSLWAQVQRPESVGYAHIRSRDPFEEPSINPRFLTTEKDKATSIYAVRRAREIASASPLASVIDMEKLPGSQVRSDDEILDFIRRTGSTTYHYVGTCKMGEDSMAVVDHRLRVRGIDGLRVADASIMPMIISGNTSIPSMMIGEKCADMLLEDVEATLKPTIIDVSPYISTT